MGDHALIKFTSGELGSGPTTFWLVDKGNNTIRPFESETALKKAFGPGFNQAMQNVVVLSPPNVDENGDIADGVLEGFSILGSEYAIKEDGSAKELNYSPAQLKKRYGKPIDENAEGLAAEALDGILNMIKKKEKELNLPKNALDKLKKDSKHIAFYISALAYGEYTLRSVHDDILQELKD
jgi:hypothetical protein